MDKRVKKHLEAEGFSFETASKEDVRYIEWFEKNILRLDSEEYRKEFWHEVHTTGHTIGRMPRTLDTFLSEHCCPHAGARSSLLFWIFVIMGGTYPFWLIFGMISKFLNLKHRRTYYPQETARRQQLAEERRAVVVRRTTNPQPTLQSIRESYEEIRRTRGRSADVPPEVAALRLGSLLEDLECYVDNHILVRQGVFGCHGRAGGIKRLLEREAPDLFAHYKSLMGYKALAKRFRQSCGAKAPVPVEACVPADKPEPGKITIGGIEFPDRTYLRNAAEMSVWMREHGNIHFLRTQSWAGNPDRTYSENDVLKNENLEIAAEILNKCRGSLTALRAEISLRIDPECIPDRNCDRSFARNRCKSYADAHKSAVG